MNDRRIIRARDVQPFLGQIVKPTTLTGGLKVYMANPARIINPEVEGAELQTEVDAGTLVPIHIVSAQGPDQGDYVVGMPLGPRLVANRSVGGLAKIHGRLILTSPWILAPSDPSTPNALLTGYVQFLKANAGTGQDLPKWIDSDIDWAYAGGPFAQYGWADANGTSNGMGGYTNNTTLLTLKWHNPVDPSEGIDYSGYQTPGLWDYWIQREPYAPVIKRAVQLDPGGDYDLGTDTVPLEIDRWKTTSNKYYGLACYEIINVDPVTHLTVYEGLSMWIETPVGRQTILRTVRAGYDSQSWTLQFEASTGATEKWVYVYSFTPLEVTNWSGELHGTTTIGKTNIGDMYLSVRATKYIYNKDYTGDSRYYTGSGVAPPDVENWHPHCYTQIVRRLYANPTPAWTDDVQADYTLNIFNDWTLLSNRPTDVSVVASVRPFSVAPGSESPIDPFGGTVSIHLSQDWRGWPAQVRWATWHP